MEETSQPEVTVQPEVTSQLVPRLPEVSARPEVKKCALLHNGITGLIFVLNVVRLRLWYRFGGDFKQRMRVE